MLYEPTNIIPSTMTQTGTVAATTDNVNIQWQVNGNSAMTMFQIDIMKNNADSTPVYSTGAVTENPTVAQGYSLPFYGKDRFGDYVQFVYQPNQTWSAWSRSAILDGNSYKFRITQFFQENGTACKLPITSNLSAGTTYYFSYSVNGTTQYVSFTVANASYFVGGNTIYFNFSHSAGWVATSDTNSRAITDITFSVSETQPSGTQLSGAGAVSSGDTFYNQFFTAQNSASSFITRTEPTLTITPLTEAPVASATQNFTATYSQAQGDSINTVRWQLYNADDMSTPIDDTGEISTSVLSYEYNGLFDGQSYSVICTATTENGVSVSATLNFFVQYEQGTYDGDFTAQFLCRENANLLKWDSISAIPGVNNPTGSATVSNGRLILPENSTVTWSEKIDNDGETSKLNFQAPWTIVWSGDINQIQAYYAGEVPNLSYEDNYISWSTFNNDGSVLFLGDKRSIYTYSVSGTTFEAKSLEHENGYSCSLNPNNTLLAVFDGNEPMIYSVDGADIVFLKTIEIHGTGSSSNPGAMGGDFNHIGNIFVAGGDVFSVSSQEFTYLYSLDSSSLGVTVGGNNLFKFSPDGSLLIVYEGSFSDCVIFSVSGTEISPLMKLDKLCRCCTFTPDGKMLIVAGYNGCYVYSIIGEEIQLLYELKKDGLSFEYVEDVAINQAGNILVIGGGSLGGAPFFQEIFSISGENINWVTSIFKNGAQLDFPTETISFSPNNIFIIGSGSDGVAEIYELNTPDTKIEKLFVVSTNNIYVARDGQQISMKQINENGEDVILGTTSICGSENGGANQIEVTLTPSAIQVYSFLNGQYIGMQETSISYSQQTILSAQLQGEQTCNYFTIIDGDGSNIAANLTDYTWEPEWDNENYTVDLLANFNYGIDGGTATQTGTGFRIYRRKSDGTENIELATLPSTTLSLRDYGIKSNESYIYDFYVYDANGAFMGVRSTETTPLKRQFKRFSLLSTQYNESDGCYHVVKEYQFSCNIQDMAVSNNSNKSYVQNFTPYPTVFQSTANYASGTLQALIGFVDPKAYKYWDSTQLMDELNALSTTTNTLFLKDMKGHLWMVDVGTVQMTATQKTREMQVTISLPWTEIGAASDVSIIQTPDDEGWDYGEQVLDVKLDVDVNTGLLYVTYPFPYNGTAFYLVGTNPVGSENIVQPLPETASSPQDGILKAKERDK